MLYNERAGGEDRGEDGRRGGGWGNRSDGPWGGDSSLLLTFFMQMLVVFVLKFTCSSLA